MCFNGRRQSWNVISKLKKKASIHNRQERGGRVGGVGPFPPSKGLRRRRGGGGKRDGKSNGSRPPGEQSRSR